MDWGQGGHAALRLPRLHKNSWLIGLRRPAETRRKTL
jgi:hypothetical protein